MRELNDLTFLVSAWITVSSFGILPFLMSAFYAIYDVKKIYGRTRPRGQVLFYGYVLTAIVAFFIEAATAFCAVLLQSDPKMDNMMLLVGSLLLSFTLVAYIICRFLAVPTIDRPGQGIADG